MTSHAAAADDGRAAVYAAELAAFDGTRYESVVPYEQLVELTERVTAASWWPHGPVEVRPARSGARSSSANQRVGQRPVVRLAAPQLTLATLAHELAHVLAGVGCGHGPVYRRAHADLVGHLFGADEATWLLDAYAAMGLTPGARHWPAPPERSSGPIAL